MYGISIHRYVLMLDFYTHQQLIASSDDINNLLSLYDREVNAANCCSDDMKRDVYIYDYDKDAKLKEFNYDADLL